MIASAVTGPVIAVVGDVLVDVVVRPEEPRRAGSDTTSAITWRQGGAAANTAVWITRVGGSARLLGRVGDDLGGTALREELAAAGVDAWLATDPARPTGTVVALVAGGPDGAADRDMFTGRGASAHLAPDDLVVGWLDGVTHLHLSGYALLHPATRPAALAALDGARAAGVPISVDPASTGPLLDVGTAAFLGWLPDGVLLTPNRAEARVLSGEDDPARAARALAARVGEVVVTLGRDGALWSDGQDVREQPAPGRPRDVDPVGAGDAFTAGLLVARAAGAPVDDQLRRAVQVAADAVGRLVDR